MAPRRATFCHAAGALLLFVCFLYSEQNFLEAFQGMLVLKPCCASAGKTAALLNPVRVPQTEKKNPSISQYRSLQNIFRADLDSPAGCPGLHAINFPVTSRVDMVRLLFFSGAHVKDYSLRGPSGDMPPVTEYGVLAERFTREAEGTGKIKRSRILMNAAAQQRVWAARGVLREAARRPGLLVALR